MKHLRNIFVYNSKYKDAIDALNSMQTNAQVLLKSKSKGAEQNIEKANKYLSRSGVTVGQLEKKLSIIHVSGTKGKGSTCAFCESILHAHGYKTGLFSSPHLVAVRERIRINQLPLSESVFSSYFWKVYNSINDAKEDDTDMPSYFKFLLVMALNVFIAERVDVVIIEVGIGGRYDCTNIFKKTSVVGISSLGLDHTTILGSTLDEIAWQKGGIMKPGCLAFTSPQPVEAMNVLRKCALDNQCSLLETPPISTYYWQGRQIELGIKGQVQMINASLALQLSWAWMNRNQIENNRTRVVGCARPFKIDQQTAKGLASCKWPGRYQILTRKAKTGTQTYYLDSAHTSDSIELCVQWFCSATSNIYSRNHCTLTLVFNITGDRDAAKLLPPLISCNFDLVYFCPNVTESYLKNYDLKNKAVTSEQQMSRCETNRHVWQELKRESKAITQEVKVCSSVSEVLTLIQVRGGEQHVLVTGSLHLVAAVLSVLDPHLTST